MAVKNLQKNLRPVIQLSKEKRQIIITKSTCDENNQSPSSGEWQKNAGKDEVDAVWLRVAGDQSNHHISSRSKRTGSFSYMSCHHSCHNFLLHHQNDQFVISHVLYVAKHFAWNYFFHLSSPERFLLWDQSNEFVTGVHLKIDSNLRCTASLTCCWRCSSQRHERRSCSLFQVSGHISRWAACRGM